MKSTPAFIGLALYVLAVIGTNLFVAPYAQPLSSLFGIFGAYAGLVFSGVITFPVLILVFYLANRAGVHGEIPEVS